MSKRPSQKSSYPPKKTGCTASSSKWPSAVDIASDLGSNEYHSEIDNIKYNKVSTRAHTPQELRSAIPNSKVHDKRSTKRMDQFYVNNIKFFPFSGFNLPTFQVGDSLNIYITQQTHGRSDMIIRNDAQRDVGKVFPTVAGILCPLINDDLIAIKSCTVVNENAGIRLKIQLLCREDACQDLRTYLYLQNMQVFYNAPRVTFKNPMYQTSNELETTMDYAVNNVIETTMDYATDNVVIHPIYQQLKRQGETLQVCIKMMHYIDPAKLSIHNMITQLNDYQREGISWMIQQEHPTFRFDEPNHIVQFFKRTQGSNGVQYVHTLTDAMYKTHPKFVRGGINAYDMVNILVYRFIIINRDLEKQLCSYH